MLSKLKGNTEINTERSATEGSMPEQSDKVDCHSDDSFLPSGVRRKASSGENG